MSVETLPIASRGQRLAVLTPSFLPAPRTAGKLEEAPATPVETVPERGKQALEQSLKMERTGRRKSSLGKCVRFRVLVLGPSWQLTGLTGLPKLPRATLTEVFSYVISCLCPLPLFLSLGTTEKSLAPSCLPSLAPPGISIHGWEPLKPSPDGPVPALPASPCSDGSHWWRAVCFLPAAALPASAPLTEPLRQFSQPVNGGI